MEYLEKRYQLSGLLGEGSFGKVYKAINITANSKYFGLYIAVKEISIQKLNGIEPEVRKSRSVRAAQTGVHGLGVECIPGGRATAKSVAARRLHPMVGILR